MPTIPCVWRPGWRKCPPGTGSAGTIPDGLISSVHGRHFFTVSCEKWFAEGGVPGVVMAADAAVHATHAPCEGGVVAGRPIHTFSPPPTLPTASVTNVTLAQGLSPRPIPRAITVSAVVGKVSHYCPLSFALTCTPDQPVSYETTGYQPYVRFSR